MIPAIRAASRRQCRIQPATNSINYRRFSSPAPPPIRHNAPKAQVVPPPLPQKKHSLLGPTPKKPDLKERPSVLARAIEHKSASSTNASSTPVIEMSKRDLEDAEKHGLMKPAPPNANWARRLLHKAIELFKFYYRGIKLVFTNRKRVAEIKSRIHAGGSPMTRTEFRFIEQYYEDIRKLVPFIIIVLVVEEIVPLIAIYAPFMLPSTCILPSQKERIHSQKETKALSIAAEYQDTLKQLANEAAEASPFSLSRISIPEGFMAICGILRLSTWGPDLLRKRRIRQHLNFIARDDELLAKEEKLKAEEVRSALEERGLLFSEVSLSEQRRRLNWWLSSITQGNDGEDAVSTRLRYILRNGVSSA
ncbi:hypothetical protein CCMSSC00406_0002534 [Pleurotus cornucopiae]|uniref:Uncharacterized protein n=1 Tax=Pleurotus cornucopiae TaxID=5321 RepID=A0ACB7IUX3_PLECO|nr:hypothetical protein CCMSSC00406_0002534 [Pleurotus cornucopiae]